jgi:hypothetical protein
MVDVVQSDRTAIGGNSPPALAAMSLHIEDLFSLVSGTLAGGAVTTDEQEAGLDALLDDVRTAMKHAEAACEAEYRPHKAAGDAVKAAWKPVTARCNTAALAIKNALTPYRSAKQRAKDEAARIAREEAEAKQAAAKAALRASDDLEERFAAEAQLAAAAKLQAQANRIDRSATGLRTFWTAEIADLRAAMLHYMVSDRQEFVDLVERLAARDARGTRAPVPGVVFVEGKQAI